LNTKVKSLAIAAAAGVAFALISSPASAAVGTVTSINAAAGSTVSTVTFTQPTDAATNAYTYAYKLYPNGNPSGAQPAVAITATPDAGTGVVSFGIDTVCTAWSGTPVACTATQGLLENGTQFRIQIGSSTDGTNWTWTSTTGSVKVYATGVPSTPTITAAAANAALSLTGVTWATPGLDPSNTVYPFTGYDYTTDGGTTVHALTWDGTNAALPVAITTGSDNVAIANDSTYHLAIRAENSKGHSAWSNILELTPRLYSVPTVPVVTVAAGTLGGTVVATLVTASVATGANLVGYQYAINPDCTSWTNFSFSGSTAIISVTGGVTASLCFRAYDDAATVGYSDATTASTPVMVLTTCSSVVKPTLVYSLTSKNLTPAGRRVLNRFATALAGSDCTSVSFNTVVRFSRTSVAFSRGQRRLGALRNTVVTDYLVGRGVAADMLHSSVTVSNRAASINRTSFSASH
jgi:hypothetical protein